MADAEKRMATDETLQAVKNAILALPNATQTAADNANAAATAANNAVARLDGLVANPYSAEGRYQIGDYVHHSGNLYRCVANITAPEAWNQAHWNEVHLGNDLEALAICAGLTLGYAGNVLTDANDARKNSIYYVIYSTTNYPENMPPVTENGYLLTLANGVQETTSVIFYRQIYFDTSFRPLYWRRMTYNSGGDWEAWNAINKTGMVEEVLGYANDVLDNADNAKPNSIYRLFVNELQHVPSNLPCLESGWLITAENKAKGYNIYYFKQVVLDENLRPIYMRQKIMNNGSGSWTNWATVPDIYDYLTLDAPSLLYVEKSRKGYYIDGASGACGAVENYAYTIIPVTPGQTYIVQPRFHVAFFTSDSNIGSSTQGYISGGVLGGEVEVPNMAAYMTVSFPFANIKDWWVGLKTGHKEVSIGDKLTDAIHNVIRVELDGTGDFTKLTDALAYGMEHRDTTIYLGDGTFDLYNELGAEYFENFVYEPYTNMGPMIGNGTHLICSPKSKIVFNYTGDNQDVLTGFSPLNPSAANTFRIGDFIVEGATIEASNCRYCVHDDVGIQTVPARHEYRRCRMYLDNTGRNGGHHCIGGGMGCATDIVVEDCYFEGYGAEGADAAHVSWHNDDYTQPPQGSIVISNNFFAGEGTVRISCHGSYENKTPVRVSNNSIGSAVIFDTDAGSAENFELFAWNNEIREE